MSQSNHIQPAHSLTDFNRHSLYEACTQEALRLGGDEHCAEYFFVRAQSSRVWFSTQGTVTIADMAIEDWCAAIAWSAPGIGRPPKSGDRQEPHFTAAANDENEDEDEDDIPESQSDSRATSQSRKQPRSGAQFRRPSDSAI